jgi:predicted Zn-dependent protease with MMP-like domain
LDSNGATPIVEDAPDIDNTVAAPQHDLMERMSFGRFARIVRRVLETLPPEFEPYLENLAVDIEEEPDLRTLRQLGFTDQDIADGDSLLGLYAFMDPPVAFNDPTHAHDWPRRIYIFKRPLEEAFPDAAKLEIEIRKTVIHELAHHFGFSERDLERWDANPNPFGDEVQEGD